MADQLNFTLNFSHNYKSKKTRLRLDFVPEFSTELNSRTEIPPFDPARVREALNFVSGEIIQRVVEHLRKTNLKTPSSQKTWEAREAALIQWKEAANKGNAKGAGKAVESMDPHDKKIRKQVEDLIKNWKSDPEETLTSIAFEEMSAGQATYSVQKVANTDVPPPRWP